LRTISVRVWEASLSASSVCVCVRARVCVLIYLSCLHTSSGKVRFKLQRVSSSSSPSLSRAAECFWTKLCTQKHVHERAHTRANTTHVCLKACSHYGVILAVGLAHPVILRLGHPCDAVTDYRMYQVQDVPSTSCNPAARITVTGRSSRTRVGGRDALAAGQAGHGAFLKTHWI
jgi:hypothetical protein